MTPETRGTPRKPAPQPTPDTEDYWAGTREGELRLQRCEECQDAFFYPRSSCPGCGSTDVASFASSGRGRLHTYVISHRAAPGFEADAPYAIAVVELDEGPRLLSNIVGVENTPEQLVLDMALEVAFEPRGDEMVPVFRPVVEGRERSRARGDRGCRGDRAARDRARAVGARASRRRRATCDRRRRADARRRRRGRLRGQLADRRGALPRDHPDLPRRHDGRRLLVPAAPPPRRSRRGDGARRRRPHHPRRVGALPGRRGAEVGRSRVADGAVRGALRRLSGRRRCSPWASFVS